MRARRWMLGWAWGSVALAAETVTPPSPAPTAPAPVVTAPPVEDDGTPTITIVGDRFARWDRTRWYAEMQLGFPLPFPLYAARNNEVRVTALQVRTELFCEKAFRRGKKGFEVHCDVRDLGLQAVVFDQVAPHAQEVLDEYDRKISEADLILFASDDGRINDVGFEGFEASNNRELTQREGARQLMLRLISGFHMKVPKPENTYDGQWVEHNPALLRLPVVNQVNGMSFSPEGKGGSVQYETFTSMGSSYVVHQIDRYKGHQVVQSEGKGLVTDGAENEDQGNQYLVTLHGVALYDPSSGIMTERVYAVTGETTASSRLADGWGGSLYFHSGRLQKLADEAPKAVVGPTRRVAPPGAPATDALPAWVPME